MINMVKLCQDNFNCIRVAMTSSTKIDARYFSNHYQQLLEIRSEK